MYFLSQTGEFIPRRLWESLRAFAPILEQGAAIGETEGEEGSEEEDEDIFEEEEFGQ